MLTFTSIAMLLGSAAAFPISSSNTQSFVAISGIDGSYWNSVIPHYDCRGLYADTGLMRVDEASIASLSLPKGAEVTRLGSTDDAMWVIECLNSECETALPASVTDDITLLEIIDNKAFVSGDALSVSWPKYANVMSVPSSSQHPVTPLDTHPVMTMEARNLYNQVVADVIARVNEDNLRENVESLSRFHSRHAESWGAVAAQYYLMERYQALGYEVTDFPLEGNDSSNVIAEVQGSVHPDQYIIVGAHYDSRMEDVNDKHGRAPGADDNGSGSAGLLEMARVVMEAVQSGELELTYSIRFVAFSGEEGGLRGSRQYAAHLRETGANVVVMFNGDMLGYRLPGKEITLGMKDRHVSLWLLSVANSLTNLYVPDLNIEISPSCCSDHQAFTENGFQALGFFENGGSASDYPFYHTTNDLPENLDYDQHRELVRAWLASVLTFAAPLH